MIPRRNVKKKKQTRLGNFFFGGGGGEIRCIRGDVPVEYSGFTE